MTALKQRWTLARSWFTALCLLMLGLLTAQTALAQEVVTTRLEPVGGSGVSGTATVRATGDDTASVSLEVSGLVPGISSTVQLRAGTCATPSASFGLLGTLQPDAAGNASLSTSTVRVSATGAVTPLEFSLLTDGDRLLQVVSTEVVACGEIPRSAAVAAPPALPAAGNPPGASVAPLLAALGLLGLGWGLLLHRRPAR